MIDISGAIDLARQYRLAMLPVEQGWLVGQIDTDGWEGCYVDVDCGIIDGHLGNHVTAPTLVEAIVLCVKEITDGEVRAQRQKNCQHLTYRVLGVLWGSNIELRVCDACGKHYDVKLGQADA